ncbi:MULTISPECIES: ATP-binding protein [unclassified Streptomyces]|uniref:ATP-binding protein n=1 Tax=unclassified Streptomyces TaxID=2593676 RepID=UPI0036626142
MTPTAAIARTDPSTAPHLSVCDGIEVSFARASDSEGDGIAEADRVWPSQVRRIVRAGLRHWGRPDLAESAELLATELVTNALRHGCGDIVVRLHLAADRLRLDVQDGSHESPLPRNAAPDDEDGRGLLLVTAIADDWGVSHDGTTTWCTLPF